MIYSGGPVLTDFVNILQKSLHTQKISYSYLRPHSTKQNWPLNGKMCFLVYIHVFKIYI